MCRPGFSSLLLLAITLASQEAAAQVTIDVSKITCEQYLNQSIAQTRSINLWVSGFYAGLRNKPLVDTQLLDRNAVAISNFCESNRSMKLLEAVEATAK